MYDFQRASMWKRISAALCDFIALATLTVGLAFLLSALLGYDAQAERLEAISETYEANYGVDFDITEEEYAALTEAEKALHETARTEFSRDPEANQVYSLIVNLTFIMITLSILFAYLLLELLVPLLFGNGQTLGKKVFGIAVMREDGVKLAPILLFTRAILGKYTVETMVPVLVILMIYWDMIGILGTILVFGMLILQFALVAMTSERRALHDKISHTVVVDFASQKIFDTAEDMVAFKKRVHAEAVESEREN